MREHADLDCNNLKQFGIENHKLIIVLGGFHQPGREGINHSRLPFALTSGRMSIFTLNTEIESINFKPILPSGPSSTHDGWSVTGFLTFGTRANTKLKCNV